MKDIADIYPSQSNSQNLKIVVNFDCKDLAGTISGTTFLETNENPVSGVGIDIYFGAQTQYPIYSTKSDNNGNFIIDSLPPGYYTLCARSEDKPVAKMFNIKVLPGQNCVHSIFIKEKTREKEQDDLCESQNDKTAADKPEHTNKAINRRIPSYLRKHKK